MASPEHHPGGDHAVGWLFAAITGAFSLLRSLLARRPSAPPPDPETEIDSALSRGAHRAAILARLDELEARQIRGEAGFDRIEWLINEMQRDLWRELEQQEHRLSARIDARH